MMNKESNTPKLLSINLATSSQEQRWTESGNRTGIDKRPTSLQVFLSSAGVEGDHVVDRKNHGGIHKAVYAYAREDALWWEEKIGEVISYGRFGENLTTKGVDITDAIIGERWRIGGVVLEVSEPRIPCRIFSGFWNRKTLIKEFTEANRSGTYLRVITEGTIEAGMDIEIVSKPSHGITVGDIFEAISGSREKIAEIALVAELSDQYRSWAARLTSPPPL